MTDARVCTQCSQSKQLSDFNKNKAAKDGLECACRDCRKIYKRAYRASHPDKVVASNKAFREAHPAYNKAWVEANADHKAALDGKGNAIERGGSTSEIYDVQLCIPFYAEARRLSKDTGVLHHVDHIIPISKGGLHCQTNLQVLTAFDNFQKGNSVGQSH